ncbi:hypothetical protein CFP56_035042, partial [Quercus suber]
MGSAHVVTTSEVDDVKKICHRGFGIVTFADDPHLPGLPDIVLENAAPIANDMVAADPSSTVLTFGLMYN